MSFLIILYLFIEFGQAHSFHLLTIQASLLIGDILLMTVRLQLMHSAITQHAAPSYLVLILQLILFFVHFLDRLEQLHFGSVHSRKIVFSSFFQLIFFNSLSNYELDSIDTLYFNWRYRIDLI